MNNCKSARRDAASYIALALALTATGGAVAYDVNDQLAINGLLAGAGQCQEITGGTPLPTLCRGAVVFQPEVSYTPTKQDQLYAKLDFAGWNGLNPVSPFVLIPWAASLEADVHHINGSNRNYLLEAWYAHTFAFAAENNVQITGGIIDPTRYVDGNAFANDEYTQFMNEIFINSHNGFIPSYDWGGAAVWQLGHWTLSGVGTNVTKNGDGYNYNWFAGEIAYNLKNKLGDGNYRLMVAGTSRAFLSPAPAIDPNVDPTTILDPPQPSTQRRSGVMISCDQELGKIVGAFLRVGWQAQDALVDYGSAYSGGFNFKGVGWGRERDNIGLGFAYLEGGNGDLAHTNVFETYYRLAFNDHLALSADVQYMQDKYRAGTRVEGWIFGLRAVAEF